MLALFATLFDIIRLRRGPDAIPYSWLLCLLALTLWLFAGLAFMLLSDGVGDEEYLVGTLTGVVALACYAAIIVTTGHTPRLLQTVTAILGCSAVLNFIVIAANVFLDPYLGESLVITFVRVVILWSIAVEGHILAKSIDRPLFIGIVAALAVFILQLYLYSLLVPPAVT